MAKRKHPDPEELVRILRKYFFCRTDHVAILAPWDKPCPVKADGVMIDLLQAHIRGSEAPKVKVRYSTRRSTGVLKGRFRIGSYTPAKNGKTRWLCIDMDGAGHADALKDSDACAREVVKAFDGKKIPVYLERSGGGNGWHLWCFFSKPIPAGKARRLAFAMLPHDIPLSNGGLADPQRGYGVEVFPKQERIGKNGFGNLVWLPWWSEAPEGANLFYRFGEGDALHPYIPDLFDTVDEETLDRVLEDYPLSEDQAVKTRLDDSIHDAWDAWRKEALTALPLESIYGPWLTGKKSGDGWHQCRDPNSPSGDQKPSAGVADGSRGVERGSFHSFISGRTISVFDFMVEQHLAADFKEALQKIAELSNVTLPFPEHIAIKIKAHKEKGLPVIRINDRQLRDIVTDAWTAVLEANESGELVEDRPYLFLRSGTLCRVTKGTNGLFMECMDESTVYGLLARVASWVKITPETCINVSPVRNVARDMLAFPDENLPPLEAIVTTPVFGRGGNLISIPGYHREEGLLYQPDEDLELPEVPGKPTDAQVKTAKSLLLDDLLIDFPFVDDSDRTHLIAAMVLPFVRRMIPGCTPLHLIEAPTAGSGKGLSSNIISLVVTGQVCAGRTLSDKDDEARKMITAELSRAYPLILLDNVDSRRELNSPSLASVITSVSWTDRILGVTSMVTLPNQALWLITANNPRLSMEIARRCVRVRIDPRMDRPWQRTDFKHPQLVEWGRKNRSHLVHAVLVLVQRWIAAGCPLYEARLGSFEHWSGVIGGILKVAGIPGFLGNLEALYEEADAEGQMWREFTAAWWEEFGGEHKKVSELNELCERREMITAVRGTKNERSQQSLLGRALANARDRVFNAFRITKVHLSTRHKGGTYYALIREDRDSTDNLGTWGLSNQCPQQSPQFVNQDIGESYEEIGDFGDFRHVPTHKRGGEKNTSDIDALYIRGTRRNVPNVPKNDVSKESKEDYVLGTSPFKVPTKSPHVPNSQGSSVDLAEIPDSVDEWDDQAKEGG